MKTFPMKRVTVIGADSIREVLLKDFQDLGVKGYTFEVVNGAGAFGIRPNDWVGPNVKFEVVTTIEQAEKILEYVAKKYFGNYAVIGFLDDVEVLRPEKFTGE